MSLLKPRDRKQECFGLVVRLTTIQGKDAKPILAPPASRTPCSAVLSSPVLFGERDWPRCMSTAAA